MSNANIHPIVVPKWGMTMERATLVAWLVEEGAAVVAGVAIVEIETEKIANAVEAPHAGILRRQLGKVGEPYMCGALIGVIADASVPEEEIAGFVAEHAQAEVRAPSGAAAPAPQVVEIGGHALRYLVQGAGGVPILLIHGFAGDLNNWLFVQPSLAEQQITYAVDLPGHGGSSKDLIGFKGLADVADLLAAFLDHLGVSQVNLVAHSMGASIALALRQRHPGRVASLVLLGPTGLRVAASQEFIDGLIAAKNRSQMSAVLKMLLADESLVSRDMVNDLLKFKRIDGAEAALRKFGDFLSQENGSAHRSWSGDAIPVHVIWGAQDRIVPPPATLAGLPGNAQLTVLDGVGHMPHLEGSSQTVELIRKTVRL